MGWGGMSGTGWGGIEGRERAGVRWDEIWWEGMGRDWTVWRWDGTITGHNAVVGDRMRWVRDGDRSGQTGERSDLVRVCDELDRSAGRRAARRVRL